LHAPASGPSGNPSPPDPRFERRKGYLYERRRPETTKLHQVVRDNLNTLYAAVDAGFGGAQLPGFVRLDLERFIDCGLLQRGFAYLKCTGQSCQERHLVAFSCKGRGFCPSCAGRRMCATSLNLLDHVLPAVGLRQFVLTFPFELRALLAYNAAAMAASTRLFVDSVLGWYRRRLRDQGITAGRSGAVAVLQRSSADLRLNPHLHVIVLDGVFSRLPEQEPLFHPLPRLSSIDVADILQVARVRILRYLQRRALICVDPEAITINDELFERDPALAQLAAAAVSGLPPAGPALRAKGPVPLPLPNRPGLHIAAPLSVIDQGFSLHAATRAGALDTRGREALLKYVLRLPIAHERLGSGPGTLVRLTLKKPFSDGTWAVDLDPLSLMFRLAALVPPAFQHQIRYFGVLSAHAAWRPLIVPPPASTDGPPPPTATDKPKPPGHRCRYLPWAELLRRCFFIDVLTCPSCSAPMKLVALIKATASIQRLLEHLGLPAVTPPIAPARAPPFWPSTVVRLRPDEQLQTRMFDS